jgi:hypothetical protein
MRIIHRLAVLIVFRKARRSLALMVTSASSAIERVGDGSKTLWRRYVVAMIVR